MRIPLLSAAMHEDVEEPLLFDTRFRPDLYSAMAKHQAELHSCIDKQCQEILQVLGRCVREQTDSAYKPPYVSNEQLEEAERNTSEPKAAVEPPSVEGNQFEAECDMSEPEVITSVEIVRERRLCEAGKLPGDKENGYLPKTAEEQVGTIDQVVQEQGFLDAGKAADNEENQSYWPRTVDVEGKQGKRLHTARRANQYCLPPENSWSAFKWDVFFFMEHPGDSRESYRFNVLYSILIFLSVLCPILATTRLNPGELDALGNIDIAFTLVFAVEMIVKSVCCPELRRHAFLTSYYTIIDFVVVLSGFLRVAFWSTTNIWLTLFFTQMPVLRLLKITRHSEGWRLLIHSIRLCLPPLSVPVFLMFLMVIFSGSLHWWIDSHFACGTPGDPRDPHTCDPATTPAFDSILDGMWFVLVTMSTVGYGDLVPHTVAGRFLAVLQIVVGIGYIAMPLSIIGMIFTTVWSQRHRLILQDKLIESGMTEDDIRDVFVRIDIDGSGVLELEEFKALVQELHLGLTDRGIRDVFNEMDADKSQTIDFEEFVEYMMHHTEF